MKTSEIKALIKKRKTATASLEQGDISIVVNQDGASTDGVDVNASEPMSLTEPDLPISDQPEVDDTIGAGETADADTLDSGDAAGDIQDTDASISEGEDAINALESYLVHVRALKASKMPVSAASVEALHLGISAALGRWNTAAAEIGIPSQESVALNQVASLESMETELVATMEGIGSSINDFFSKYGAKVSQLFSSTQSSLKKQQGRLDAAIASAKRLGTAEGIPNVTDKRIIKNAQAIVLDAKTSGEALAGIKAINASAKTIVTDRVAKIGTIIDATISKLENGDGSSGELGSAVNSAKQEIANVLTADASSLRFVSTWTTAQKLGMLGGTALAVGTVGSATVIEGALLAGVFALIGNKIKSSKYQSTGATTTKAKIQDGASNGNVAGGVPALTPADVVTAATDTKAAIEAIAAADFEKISTAGKVLAQSDAKFSAASARADAKYHENQSEEEDELNAGRGASLDYAKDLLRNYYQLETELFKAIRFSVEGTVDYIVESVKAAEQAAKAAA